VTWRDGILDLSQRLVSMAVSLRTCRESLYSAAARNAQPIRHLPLGVPAIHDKANFTTRLAGSAKLPLHFTTIYDFVSKIFRFRRDDRQMYRCHFMHAGRITQGCNLKVETLDAAIATCQKILADHFDPDDCDGLEIWLDSALLYEFSV
jgi:hypothetical protein